MVIEATKPNENFPPAFVDQGITLNITWASNPMAGTTLEYLKAAPEDPPGEPMGVGLEEPCGKSLHRGGVLLCRKLTTPWVGLGEGPDLVTWNVSWAGASDTGILGVSVSFLYGDREAATGWIDGVIDMITEPTRAEDSGPRGPGSD